MLQGRFLIVVIVVVVIAGVLVAYALSDSLRTIVRKINANTQRTHSELCERGHG
jgi:archaellum component FlaG (FlaF/FlaG flagellin family)